MEVEAGSGPGRILDQPSRMPQRRRLTQTIAMPAPLLDVSSVPEKQNQQDDRDRNPKQPKKNASTHGIPPFRSQEANG